MQSRLDPALDLELRALVRASGIPLKTMSEAVGTGTAEILNWWSDREAKLNEKALDSFGRFFGVSPEHLFGDSRDQVVQLIRQRLFHGPRALPEAYNHQTSSFVRATAHIVDYVALTFGRRSADHILMGMNVHPLIFDDLDNRINLRFIIDLLNELKTMGVPDDQIESLGSYIFLSLEHTKLGAQFRTATSYRECYAVVAANSKLFDTNFEYKVEIDRREVRLYAIPTEGESILAQYRPEQYRALFDYKRGLMGWFPSLCNLAPLNTTTPYCVSKGDPFTLYRMEIPIDGGRGSLANLRYLGRPLM
jgi:hypothetical protein